MRTVFCLDSHCDSLARTAVAAIMRIENMSNDDLWNTKKSADYLNMKENTLNVWRCTGRYRIPYIKIGTRVFYKKVDLDAWLESRRCEVA